jgi:hypothetical protein
MFVVVALKPPLAGGEYRDHALVFSGAYHNCVDLIAVIDTTKFVAIVNRPS